ncbi:MAG TPA: SET domain-containing protein-lysine N-methyltransferase [Steroidobacteraceae bacterium]
MPGTDVRCALIEVRRSSVHGLGVFAAQRIAKGTRLIEYVGERVSHEEADQRYEDKDANDSHTFLFIIDSRTVIDAGVDGNDARFFNHSCNPNCESVIERRRVYIEALRTIEPGTELTYDYQIQREDDDPDDIDEVFACHCGFAQCRGTMLWPTQRKATRAARRGPARAAKGPAREAKGRPAREVRRKRSSAGAEQRQNEAKYATQRRAPPPLRRTSARRGRVTGNAAAAQGRTGRRR